MIHYYISKNFLLNLPENIEIQKPTYIYMNNVYVYYNNQQYALDCVFYPKQKLLTRNLNELSKYIVSGREAKFFMPYYINNDIKENYNHYNESVLVNSTAFIFSKKLKNKYIDDIVHFKNNWDLFDTTKTIYFSFSMVWDILPYNFVLHYAVNKAEKIVFDFQSNEFEFLTQDIISLAKYFNWSYTTTNDCELILTNIQTNKLANYLSWCELYYMEYFQKLLQTKVQQIPIYDSIELYFTKIVDEKEYNNYV